MRHLYWIPIRHHFVEEFLKSDKYFVQFKGKEKDLMNTSLSDT